eukprot:COSAG01_NODE_77355_length_165_cov_4193.575758_1_plen_36_part_10
MRPVETDVTHIWICVSAIDEDGNAGLGIAQLRCNRA